MTVVTAVGRSYAAVYFSNNPWTGLLFALATPALVPYQGLLGLAGLLLTHGAARVLGVDPEGRKSGFYGLNGLLVGLALGLFYQPGLALFVLLALASLFTVAVAAASRSLAERYLGVPVLSLPFVITTWLVLLMARRFTALEFTLAPILAGQVAVDWLPGPVVIYLKSLSAALIQLNVPAGLLVLLGLLISSRWAALLSVIGYVSGLATYQVLGGYPTDLTQEFLGFNFILTAIAVGGIYVTLTPSSLLLAAAAGALSAAASAALLAALQPLGLPPLAMPFILTTHAILFALGRRDQIGWLAPVTGIPGTPEENLERTVGQRERYPDPTQPLLYLPVAGGWWVSQGNDGPHTHRGLWRHAWDLELRDAEGFTFRDEGRQPTDYYCFGLPVFAPGDGQVVHAVSLLPDCPIGEPDLTHNWGNCLVIWHGGLVWSLLAHLQQGSLLVGVGERVLAGQMIARVGSSGRSPRPHLHYQAQSGPLPGAPTVPIGILHYVEQGVDGGVYRTHGRPAEWETVSPLVVSELRREALAFPQGRSWCWQGQVAGQPRQEEWQIEIDLLGTRSLVCRPGGERIELFSDRAYTTVVRQRTRHGSLLHLLALGCPRAPHTEQALRWTDRLLPGPALNPLGWLLYQLALPFGELAVIRTRSRILPDAQALVVETSLEISGLLARLTRPLPDLIRIRFTPDQGPVQLLATREGQPWAEAELRTAGDATIGRDPAP